MSNTAQSAASTRIASLLDANSLLKSVDRLLQEVQISTYLQKKPRQMV